MTPNYISLIASSLQLLAHAKQLEVKELRSFLWRKILRKLGVEKMPHKIIFVCEPAGDDEDVIVVASWFAEKPDPAS
jgi:hypothetical protein